MRHISRSLRRTFAIALFAALASGHALANDLELARAVVEAMNRERVAYGLEPLRINRQLSLAASDRVQHMFDHHYFAHVGPDGKKPFEWIDERGYRYVSAGENLAVGYRTSESVVNGWMNSPGHRANILGAQFTEVGVAIGHGAPLRGYGSPTIVVLYASR